MNKRAPAGQVWITTRLPVELHSKLVELAKEDQRSLNTMVVRMLAAAVAEKERAATSFRAVLETAHARPIAAADSQIDSRQP